MSPSQFKTQDLYFKILVKVFMNHTLAKNKYFTNKIEWKKHKIMILEPADKYQIIQSCHIFKNILTDHYQNHSFLYLIKFCKHHLYGAENNKTEIQDN